MPEAPKQEAQNGSSGPKLLGREDILRAEDFKTEDVAVPEWGGVVRVKSLTGDERDAFEAQIRDARKDGTFRPNPAKVRSKLIAMTVIDEKGRKLFSHDDVVALGKKSAAAIERVWEVACRLSGLSKEDADEMSRDLGSAPNDDGTSAGR